ncbi:unnamed protein product [Lactuca virosa]|uniref:Uncharacterized protein n=1 Tax=Lactuca virosa TaxID=75947 RepID=A0AAU9M6J5_9ASTR|nr:unnamed protein product [Lactuca virosa]
MPSYTSTCNSWPFEDQHHIIANVSIAGDPHDIHITLLQLQFEVSLMREDVNMDQSQLRESLHREMDSMNCEVDDIRAGLLELSHLTDGPRNHFYSL